MKKLLLSALLSIASIVLFATHITHGNMYCTFDRTDNAGNFHYLITLELFRDCNASQVGFDSQIAIGLYESDNREALITMNLTSETDALIQNTTNVSTGLCYKRGVYEGEVTVPSTAKNHLAMFQRCCRPTLINIANLDIGNTFFVNINTASKSSSPKNYSSGLFVISTGQKTVLSLGNSDADGDVLTYKLVDAFKGASSIEPIPQPPSKTDINTFRFAPYNNNYSGAAPVGLSPSYATLDSLTGQLEVLASTQGPYLIAYEVSEWRGNTKINTYYREVYINVVTGTQTNTGILLQAKGINNSKAEVLSFWSHTVTASIDSFVVERSDDSATWAAVGGTTHTLQNYLDGSVTANTPYWYRVYADTGSGKVYSNVVKVGVATDGSTMGTTKKTKPGIVVYPNPANNTLFVDGMEGETYVVIYNTLGQTLKTQIINNTPESVVDVSALPAGVYFLQIVQGNTTTTQRFYKQ